MHEKIKQKHQSKKFACKPFVCEILLNRDIYKRWNQIHSVLIRSMFVQISSNRRELHHPKTHPKKLSTKNDARKNKLSYIELFKKRKNSEISSSKKSIRKKSINEIIGKTFGLSCTVYQVKNAKSAKFIELK